MLPRHNTRLPDPPRRESPARMSLPTRLRLTAALSLLAALNGSFAAGQAPSVASVSPLAVTPGAAVDLKLRGANLAGAKSLWTSFPAEAVVAPGVEGNGTNASEVTFRVTTPAEGHVGVHGLRVVTAGGASPIRLVVVDDLPSIAQQAGNTSRQAAQAVTVPCAVDGAVENLKLNYFRFKVEAGQRVAIEVLARRIGSPLDPTIRVFDPSGREIAWSDDAPGLSSDPQLVFHAPAAGEYVLELRDIRYQGSGSHVYRLRLGDFPLVNVAHPMAVQRGTSATLVFAGTDVEGVPPLAVSVPADPWLHWMPVGAKRAGGQSSGMAVLAVTDEPVVMETEPNNAAEQANRVELGATLTGRFDAARDADRFVFSAKKDQKFTFTAITRSQGSPSDLLLRLNNAAGAKIAEAEDAGTLDAALTYQFPEDGDYTLVVTDLHGRGGSPFAYRIRVQPAAAGFSLAAAADALNVPAGGTAAVTVNVARQDYGGPIELAATDLPPGLTSVPTVIGPGVNSAVLAVTASPDAAPGQLAQCRVVGRAKPADREITATAVIGDVLKAANNAMPWPPLNLTTATAVATAPAVGVKLRPEAFEVVLGPNLSATAKILVERADGFDQPITFGPPDSLKGQLPGGLTVAPAPTPEKANEIPVAVSANKDTPLGEYTVVLTGTHTKDKVAVQVPVALRLKVESHFQLALDTAGGALAKGGELKVKVTVRRNPAFSKEIAVTLQNLPAGVTAAPAKIAEGQNEVEIALKAQADAANAGVENLVAKGDAKAGDVDVSATSSPAALKVE